MSQPSRTWRFVVPDAPELAALRRLLAAEALPHEGVEGNAAARFLIAREPDGAVAGGIGLEEAGAHALLRSLVVEPSCRGVGLGERLVAEIEAAARQRGIDTLYLLTTTASGFFMRLGYTRIDRARVPAALLRLDEFSTLCPASADCLWKQTGPVAAG
jgi:amino-acid N-acetyltransferase